MPAKQSLSFALEPRAALSFDDFVADCAWSPDGKSLAVAGGEGKVGAGRGRPQSLSLRSHRRALVRHAGRGLAAARAAVSRLPGRMARSRCGMRPTRAQLKRWKPAVAATQALAYSPERRTARQRRRQGGVSLWSPAGEKVHAFAPAASTAAALTFDGPEPISGSP